MRQLENKTLDGAARRYASHFLMADSRRSDKPSGLWLVGPEMVKQDLYNLTFADEFDHVTKRMKDWLGGKALADFEALLKSLPPREDKVFHALLAERLAIDPDGNHIDGAIGRVQIGTRWVGRSVFEVETLESILARKEKGLPLHVPDRDDRVTEWVQRSVVWPVYAGEPEERKAGSSRPDPLPRGADPWPVNLMFMANVTNISAEACIAAVDAVAGRLDEGSTAATIRGRTGAQPADPDAAESGTLLFTLTMSDPAFAAAVDDADGSCSAAANSITDDTSADATGTLGYCRFGATGTGVDDHVDGNATTDGTGATDWNTLEIVSGSTVSMTSASIGQSQGSTAT